MKKTILVAIVLSVALTLGGLAVSANQVWVGNRVVEGNNLTIELTATAEGNFYGSVTLPCSGYLYIFYESPNGAWHLIFPSAQDRNNYRGPGTNALPLGMIQSLEGKQVLTVLFSPYKLLEPDFCRNDSPYLSIDELGRWCNVSKSYIWVGEREMPFVSSITSPKCAPVPVKPAPSCYQAPCCQYRPSTCCQSDPCIFAWWLLMGIMLGH